MTIEKDAEDIIEKFSKILEDIPDSDETWYITDNLNLTREDKAQAKNPEKILEREAVERRCRIMAFAQIIDKNFWIVLGNWLKLWSQ